MSPVELAATDSAPPAAYSIQGPVVTFKHVWIGFDGNTVLHDVSFTVQSGQMLILLGPAAGGKSVLLKLCNGLLQPDSGSIRIFGQEITAMPQRQLFALRRDIGMVFQESALFDSLSVRDNVAYRLREEGESDEEINQRVTESLRFVELEDAIDKFPDELSGGMRRRVAIARAIISQPKLLLYDSPTGGLDPITSTTIIQLVMKQRDVNKGTALLVTHRLQDAFMLATYRFNPQTNQMERIAGNGIDPQTMLMVLREGGIAFSGNLVELLRCEDPYIKEFLAV
jgi:phospholipid/cholesterol/gamma-HCH transport system ATP-binding protein